MCGNYRNEVYKMISHSLWAVLQSHGCAPGRLLHQSSNSAVYEGGWQGRTAAIKLLYVNAPEMWVQTDRELRTVTALQHPSVVTVYDYVWHSEGGSTVLALVTELCEKDLEREIKDRKSCGTPWTEAELWVWLREMVSLLATLQRQAVAHRDIKPANIFLLRGRFKLGDFGSAKCLREEAARTVAGTPFFLSPCLRAALLRGVSHVDHDVFRSDIYSLGVVLLYMAKLDAPMQAVFSLNPEESFSAEIEYLQYSEGLKSVLRGMLAWGERERYDFLQLEMCLNQPVAEPEVCPICKKQTNCKESSFTGMLEGKTVICCSPRCAEMMISLKTLRSEYLCPHCHSELPPALCQEITMHVSSDLSEYSVTEQCPNCFEDFDFDHFSKP